MQYPVEEFDLGLTFRWGLMTLGFAAFVDWGDAWYDGSPQRTGKDRGVGLPLGGMRAASGKGAARIDLAPRYANDAVTSQWVVSTGSGFTFERIIK